MTYVLIENDIVICPEKDLKVELGITKICYKNGKLKRYNEGIRDRIIFPYDEDNKLLKEKLLKQKYPLAYNYLLTNKEELLKRDGGKLAIRCKTKNIKTTYSESGENKPFVIKIETKYRGLWYEYGRTQGLSIADDKILIATIGKKIQYRQVPDGLFISGYAITTKKGSPYTLSDAENILKSDLVTTCLQLRAKPLSGGYYQINKQFFKNIKFNGVKNDNKE